MGTFDNPMQLVPQIGFSVTVAMNQRFVLAYRQFMGILNEREQLVKHRLQVAALLKVVSSCSDWEYTFHLMFKLPRISQFELKKRQFGCFTHICNDEDFGIIHFRF